MTSRLAAANPDGSRRCAWCAGPIPPAARADSVYCHTLHRQAAHRFGKLRRRRVATGRPSRFAYADPPYPRNARRYYADHPDYAGVYFAGLAFGLRDALHEAAGRAWVLAAIVAGTALSWIVADGITLPGGAVPLAVASGVAFGLSELADLAVYTPLRDRNIPAAVAASNLVGSVVDSALFLWLAFGTLDLLAGQVLGKMLMVVPALPVVWTLHRRRLAA